MKSSVRCCLPQHNLSFIPPLIWLMACLLAMNSVTAQKAPFTDPDHILIGSQPIPKVLLVGTWHFNYPNRDAHITDKDKQVDLFSDRRQKELNELLDYMARFQPTKIAVEGGRNSGYLLRRYERWKKGTHPLGASEIDQIALRLMDRFQLDTLYGVDAYPLILELADSRDTMQPATYMDSILERHYWGGEDELGQRYADFFRYEDSMKLQASLLDIFLYMNSDKVLDRGFGAYLSTGQFLSEGFEGPDALSMFWLNRNLRIYHNIQKIVTKPQDRILVLFGAGHVSILKYFFECSPQFELIPFDGLGKN